MDISSLTKLSRASRNLPRHIALLSLLSALLACSAPDRSRALDDPNLAATTIALQVCSNCHGVQGVSTSSNFPHLAAQQESYLVQQLQSFKSHGRTDPAGFEYMWGLSSRLTDAQIDGLAAYFSKQNPPPGKSGDSHMQERGKTIFESGVADKNIPACATCHGAQAEGNLQFPRLAGQHENYLIKQLMVFQRTDDRPQGAIMKAITHDLSDDNMKDVAAYLASMSAH